MTLTAVVTGGSGQAPSNGLPTGALAAVGIGALLALAGAGLARRRVLAPVPVTG